MDAATFSALSDFSSTTSKSEDTATDDSSSDTQSAAPSTIKLDQVTNVKNKKEAVLASGVDYVYSGSNAGVYYDATAGLIKAGLRADYANGYVFENNKYYKTQVISDDVLKDGYKIGDSGNIVNISKAATRTEYFDENPDMKNTYFKNSTGYHWRAHNLEQFSVSDAQPGYHVWTYDRDKETITFVEDAYHTDKGFESTPLTWLRTTSTGDVVTVYHNSLTRGTTGAGYVEANDGNRVWNKSTYEVDDYARVTTPEGPVDADRAYALSAIYGAAYYDIEIKGDYRLWDVKNHVETYDELRLYKVADWEDAAIVNTGYKYDLEAGVWYYGDLVEADLLGHVKTDKYDTYKGKYYPIVKNASDALDSNYRLVNGGKEVKYDTFVWTADTGYTVEKGKKFNSDGDRVYNIKKGDQLVGSVELKPEQPDDTIWNERDSRFYAVVDKGRSAFADWGSVEYIQNKDTKRIYISD